MSIIITIQPYDDIQNYLDILDSYGGGILYLNPTETYYPTSDILIPNNVTFNANYGTIDFNNQAFSIKAEGADQYTDGTISVSNGSATVTGTGTLWTNDMVGQTIFFEGNYFVISDVADSTTITIEGTYIGEALTDVDYSIATALSYLNILNVNIQNSIASGITIKNIINSSLNNVVVLNCTDKGIDLDWTIATGIIGSGAVLDSNGTNLKYQNSYGFTIDNTTTSNSVLGPNIELINSGDAEIRDSAITGSFSSGISMTGAGGISINSLTVANNTNDGIDMVSSCSDNQLFAILNINNGGYGINIEDATSENNIISINNLNNNTSGEVNDLGTSTLIRSNIGVVDN